VTTFEEFAALEAKRSRRSGRWFTLVRIAPVGWAALDEEVGALARVVGAVVRRTDFVHPRRDREVAVVLVETDLLESKVPLERIREAALERMPELQLRIGCASVGPGQPWQEAWRWAGTMLVADAAVPAAA
jgi:hypothetical protein